jgi:hypothetical protein
MKRLFYVAAITVFGVFYGLCGVAFGYGIGDVTIHLNGGDDVAYIGEVNTLEIWIANDARLRNGMSAGFEITYATALAWDMGYGSRPPVNEHGRAIGCWDLTGLLVTHDFNNVSPDHILMGGVAMMAGLPAGPSELCYTLQFSIPSGEPETNNGFSVAPYFYPPSGSWAFSDIGSYPPDFNGNPTGSMTNPVAPPATFDIVDRRVCGDVNCDGSANVGDAVYLIAYIFRGGPPPCAGCP